jgi:hypothetical protein
MIDVAKLRTDFSMFGVINAIFSCSITCDGRSQWPRGLRCGSAAALLLGLWVRIQPAAWMSVSCECCQCQADHSSKGVLPSVVCLKSVIAKPRKMRRPRPPRGCRDIGKKKLTTLVLFSVGLIQLSEIMCSLFKPIWTSETVNCFLGVR